MSQQFQVRRVSVVTEFFDFVTWLVTSLWEAVLGARRSGSDGFWALRLMLVYAGVRGESLKFKNKNIATKGTSDTTNAASWDEW